MKPSISEQDRVKEFTLEEIRKATDSFSETSEIGRGGFGVVYKGRLANGSDVAIKRFHDAKESFISETKMPVHPNLLPLLGFCMKATQKLLVFPYMINGSLASCLKRRSESKPVLSWDIRKRIAHGSAAALAHLHNSKVIHRDIKTENVLLNEKFEAVVADFDLVKVVGAERTHVTTYARGTPGYMAPEYVQDLICSEKTDVYAYGMLLLEIITGNKITRIWPDTEDNESIRPLDWITEVAQNGQVGRLVDSDLNGKYFLKEAEYLVRVALLCTNKLPNERPRMSEVIQMLEPLVQVPNTEALSLKQPIEKVTEGAKSCGVGNGGSHNGTDITEKKLQNYLSPTKGAGGSRGRYDGTGIITEKLQNNFWPAKGAGAYREGNRRSNVKTETSELMTHGGIVDVKPERRFALSGSGGGLGGLGGGLGGVGLGGVGVDGLGGLRLGRGSVGVGSSSLSLDSSKVDVARRSAPLR